MVAPLTDIRPAAELASVAPMILSSAIARRQREINFTNPFNGRRWLALLRADAKRGLRFIPNLRLPKAHLGFSFSTNAVGLRGPACRNAHRIVAGTSFGMGLSVNDGENWYEHGLVGDWLNVSIPVGFENISASLEELHDGRRGQLLFIYHPNVWKTSQDYLEAAASNRDIFTHMGWSTALWDTFRLYPIWLSKQVAKYGTGDNLPLRWGDTPLLLNCRYAAFNAERDPALTKRIEQAIQDLTHSFDDVVVVRSRIKEECVPIDFPWPRLQRLREQYDTLWQRFLDCTPNHTRVAEPAPSDFSAGDFLPLDTHWSAQGNRRFAELLRNSRLLEEVV